MTAKWTDARSRERIGAIPMTPGNVQYSDDGKLLVVTDTKVLVASYQNRELEMYLQFGPSVTKSYIQLPSSTADERLPIRPPVLEELSKQDYFELNHDQVPTEGLAALLSASTERTKADPREVSIARNDGNSFTSAVFGPRGSGPNATCAVMTLTSLGRIGLHYSPGFKLHWTHGPVLSDILYDYLASKGFSMNGDSVIDVQDEPEVAPRSLKTRKRSRARPSTMAAENMLAVTTRKINMMTTKTIAWSPFCHVTPTERTSLLALAGQNVATVWKYAPYVDASDTCCLSRAPIAWIDTEQYGWVLCSAWERRNYSKKEQSSLRLVLGTASGSILLSSIPLSSLETTQVSIDRHIPCPLAQPVLSLSLNMTDSSHLIAAYGSTISVWNVEQEQEPPTAWKAHEGNITGLDTDTTGSLILSSGIDGAVRVWASASGAPVPYKFTTPSGVDSSSHESKDVANRYPLFGVAMSSSSAQVAVVYVVPPTSRPSRRSQADVTFSRVSCAYEYIPSPVARNRNTFAESMVALLDKTKRVSAFRDVLWLCHDDNRSVEALYASAALPKLMKLVKGSEDVDAAADDEVQEPLYIGLCDALEKKHEESQELVFLQASYLLRNSIRPVEQYAHIHEKRLEHAYRKLLVHWAHVCLTAWKARNTSLSEEEQKSALAMADILSVQSSPDSVSLAQDVYDHLSPGDKAGDKASPPSRHSCYICEAPVPFAELRLECSREHSLDRCFLSFAPVSPMESCKCMGCGASAHVASDAFYLLPPDSTSLTLECRLCGNDCVRCHDRS